jgi:hypothetical protein
MLVRGDPKEVQADRRSRAGALGRINNGADTDNTLYHQPRTGPKPSPKVSGISASDDHEHNAAEWIVHDAYAIAARWSGAASLTATS